MDRFILRLQNLVWPAVLSAVLTGFTVLTGLLAPDRGNLILALGLSAIAMACLAQNA